MSESKFKPLQEDICFKSPEEEEEEVLEPDKICPTCIPNENYLEPDWTQMDEPYLNEKKCEYQVRVTINYDGDIYHDGLQYKMNDPRSRVFKPISESPYNLNTLLKSYIRPGVRKMLRYYGKLETDEIVCASPPQFQGDICKAIFGLDYEQYVTREDQLTEEPIPSTFEVITIVPEIGTLLPEIKNTNALELVARVQDYTFITSQKMLVVLIGIPAYRFDAVPAAPDLGSLDTSRDQLVIKPPDFMRAIGLFKSAMGSYKTFQSYFYREENGSLYFEETGNPFYIKFYSDERIKKFVDRLDSLLNKNGFDLRGFQNTGAKSQNIAFEIEVSFDKSDEANPFTIKNVRARKKNCPYIECKVGLQSFIDKTKTDQTMLGYFSNINQISGVLQSNKTPPWLDFIVDNTFPQLAVNYGSSDNFEDDTCIKLNLNDMSDFILNETMDLFKAIEYRFNQNKCKTEEEMLAQRAEIQDFFSGSPDSVKKLKDLKDAFKERILVPAKKIGKKKSKERKAASAAGSAAARGAKNVQLPTAGDVENNPLKAAGDFIKALNPCDFDGNLSIALKCIAASLTLDEVYFTLIKQIISSVGEEALEIIMQTLPANKQAEIRKEIEKQFKDMPFPWDPGWQGGSLGKAVDRQARSGAKDKEEKEQSAREQFASLKKQIEDLGRKRDKKKETVDRFNSEGGENSAELLRIKELYDQYSNEIIEYKSDNVRKDEEIKQYKGYITTWNGEISGLQNLPDLPEYQQRITDAQDNVREYNELIKKLEETKKINLLKIADAERRLEPFKDTMEIDDKGNYYPNKSKFLALLNEQIASIDKEIVTLEKKKSKSHTTAEELQEYQNFSDLSEEYQLKLIDKQKEKTTIVATTPSDKIQQGTLGKALGNVQKALIQAYIDEIMKTASIGELQRAIENIPGADLLGKLVSRFKCGSDPLVYPPIESFLSTLTFDPCDGEKTRFSLPAIQAIPTSFNWIEQLGDAFRVGLRQIFSRVIIALMMKTTQILNADYCQIAGNLTRNLLNDGGLEGFIEDTLCPDPKTNDQKDKLNKKVAGAGGAKAKGASAVGDLARLLSVSATQKEIKGAMVGQANQPFLDNISTLVSNVLPQFSDIFGDSNAASQYFQTMGNILTPEQRQGIQRELQAPQIDFPVETSICLTKEQKDLWDQERQAAFSDPELGKEFVNKQNEKAQSDLADIANLLINGPEDALSNAIDEALNPKDPDCKTNKGIIPSFSDYPQNQQQTISNAITGIFKRLERAFIDDTIEANFFSSLGGRGPNTPGVLSIILSNNKNDTINYHIAVKNNIILNALLGGNKMELPDTVGIQMKEYIDSQVSDYKIGKDHVIYYNNNKEGEQNFISRLVVNDTFDRSGKIELSDPEGGFSLLTDNFLEIPEEYEPNQGSITFQTPFSAQTLDKMFGEIWSQFGEVDLDSNKIFEGINADIYDMLPKTFTRRRDGQISEGFLYGNEDTPILENSDLVYVGPNGEEYDYEESEKVLGRSKTNNPRVHFLDPEKHGGTYLKPQIYIAEAEHKGWLQFSRIVVPNPTGCDPKNSNFMMLDSIVKQINKNKQKIQNHELLPYSPECTTELPFDKIANSDTLATIEGIVRATIRVHLSDFLIRSFPIFSNVHLDVNRNFDNTMLNYISKKVYKDLKNETAIFASTYEGYTYALLFLEQVTQIVHRKVRDEQMESNEEIEEILEICSALQEQYTKDAVTPKDLEYINEPIERRALLEAVGGNAYGQRLQEIARQIESGIAIIGSGGPDILGSFQTLLFDLFGLSIERAKFAQKINAIHTVQPEIKKLLKYVIKEELAIYTKKMREEIEPRPYIYDIRKFFIGGSHMLLGKQIEAGVYDNEVPIGGGVGNFPYGDVNHCAKRNMVHSLNGSEISDERYEDLKKRGGFFLEKYIVVDPKEATRLQSPFPIKGIQNIQEFKVFLNQNSSNIQAQGNVSDYFGNAVLSENGEEYEGSIGIKYGVRLCYLPPEGTELEITENEISKANRSFVQGLASFQTDSGQKTLPSSKYSFPVASFEQDILDVKMIDLINSDDNLDQDLKCYIDELVKTKNFKHLVDNVLQIKKIPSIYMIYSYNNFLASLGDTTERAAGDDENPISPSNFGKVFNDSKSEARKLFVSFYRNNDRDPPNEEENNEDIVKHAQRKILDGLKFLSKLEFSIDIQRRLVTDSPFDKDGNECKNNFGKLFKKKGF
jgi:hypothetical protein